MYTRTTTKSSTTNNRGRGRGGRGRGRGGNHNSTSTHRNVHNEDVDENYPSNDRRRFPPRNPNNRENHQSTNGLGNLRANHNSNARSNRSDNAGIFDIAGRSDIAGRPSTPDINSSRIPKHAQNPFFVGELMSRFNNMLPPSSMLLDDEVSGTQQPEVKIASNPIISNIHTLDTVRNSSPRSNLEPAPNKNNDGLYHENGNRNYEDNRFKIGSRPNRNPENNNLNSGNRGEPRSNISHQEPSAHFSSRDRMPDFRMNDNYDSNKSYASTSDNHNKNSNHELGTNHSNVNHRKAATSSKRLNETPVSLTKVSLEKRKAIMQSFGFDTELLDNKSSNSSKSQTTEINKPENNNPVSFSKVSLEKRKAIMQSFGFDTELLDKKCSDRPSSKSQTTEINKPAQSSTYGSIAERTTPRVRYNLENEPTQNSLPRATSEQIANDDSKLKTQHRYPQDNLGDAKSNIQYVNVSSGKSSNVNPVNAKLKTESAFQGLEISDTFFNQLDAMRRSTNDAGTAIPPQPNLRAGKPKNGQEAWENTHSQSSAHNYNPFLKTKRATSQNRPERSNSPDLRSQRNTSSNHNGTLHIPIEYIKRDVAGRNHFSVQRPVRDLNERVPSRAEALARIEEQYEIQRAEFEAKKREKEAKKREEYLAKYKHIDQGRRLNDGLLDEAAGYAPGYNPIETVEDIRQRQQEQLRQDALAYQQRKMEEEERQKRKEEKKAREQLEKNKHYNAGYRLGHGDNRGNPRQTSPVRGSKHKQPQNRRNKREGSEKKGCRDSISPELLLEGETEEEALQRQEDQLILEMLIQNQIELQEQNKEFQAFEVEENLKELQTNQSRRSANSETVNQFTTKPVRQTQKMPDQGSSRNVTSKQLNQSGDSLGAVSKHRLEKFSRNVERSVESIEPVHSLERNARASHPPANSEHLATKGQNVTPQPEQLDSNVSRNSLFQVPTSPHMSKGQEPLPKTPVGCVLQIRNGAVLVLRSSPEELNRALATRLEVQDEVDKNGYSAHYKPQTEQAPLYSNNRFERKPDFYTVKPTGSETYSSSVVKPSSVAATNSPLPNNTSAEEEKPAFDHKAELRAARLRFQQKYEEALKKNQEQKDDC